MDERLQKYDNKMQKSFDNLLEEFGSIRAGRANPHVLDKLKVDYYGTPTGLQQVANISVPEPRMILIQPWEPTMVRVIEKAILTSDLGINPTNDGKVIRLVFPELTEERRKELAKDVKKKGEAAKVAVRNIRRDANDSFKKWVNPWPWTAPVNPPLPAQGAIQSVFLLIFLPLPYLPWKCIYPLISGLYLPAP